MLGPEYLAEAGDLVGAVYTQIEDEMLRHLCGLMLSGAETLGQRGETALLLLAQTRSAELMAIAESHRGDVSRAVRATVEDAIARSDAADLEVLGDAAAGLAAATAPVQARLTARGIAEVLARDNVDMRRGALALWNSAVVGAAAKVNTGAATADRAVHEAVREMMREGIGAVSYRDAETGRRTVTNRVDVAVRRHVRTQLHQDGMRRTEALCRESGCQLVEVSSHSGARPSHAAWQGEVYGLDGPCEVGGKRYRGLADATGYGSVDGLGGANCRHSFGPWLPGTPRAYEREPEHPSGLPSDEVYRLEQGQRRRERAIRQAKRDLAGAQMVAERDGSLANIAEVERAKARLAARQKGMRDYIAGANAKGRAPVLHRRPKREWAGDMPRVRRSDARYLRYRSFPQSKDTMADTRGIRRLGREQITALQRDSDRAFSDMNVDQLQAVIDYTKGAHNITNQMLYGKKLSRGQAKKAKRITKGLDGAIGKFTLRQDVAVFSGTKAEHYADWKPGEIRSIDGYLSTSVRLKDARLFCKRAEAGGSPPMMVTLLVPKKSPCLFIGENTAFPEYQGELLLGRGIKYKVVSKSENSMTLEVCA